MIKIDKQPTPPEWRTFCNTPGVRYEAKPFLREALLKEQGYICAYCMRSIPCADGNSKERSRIDHILSRKKHPDLQLDYNNMVICCPGAIHGNDKNNFHCDKSKGEEDLNYTPFQQFTIDSIRYSTFDGEIRSSIPKCEEELNHVLNLNNPLLKANRREVINAVIHVLEKRRWNVASLSHELERWKTADFNGHKKAYCGIVIWYLEKKLGRL